MEILRWLHLVGMVMFAGGGIGAGIANRAAMALGEGVRGADAADAFLSRFADGGALVLFGSGIASAIAFMSKATLAHAGWLWAMVVLGLAAAALNGIAGKRARLLAANPPSGEAQHAARRTIARLRMGFVAAVLGAIATGVWRFSA